MKKLMMSVINAAKNETRLCKKISIVSIGINNPTDFWVGTGILSSAKVSDRQVLLSRIPNFLTASIAVFCKTLQ